MSLEYTLLGLLKRKPRTGYELSKIVARTTNFYWTATRTQVYQSLKRMAEREWIEMETIPQSGKPSKQVYHLLPSGEDAFKDWLHRVPEKPVIKTPILVQLYFLDCLEKDDVIKKLEAELALRTQSLHEYQEYEKGQKQHQYSSMQKQLADALPLMAGIESEIAMIRWCEQALVMIKES